MSKDLYSLMSTVKLIDVILTIGLFIAIAAIVITQKKKIKEFMEHWREKRNFEDTIMDSINGLKECDRQLQDNIDKVWDTMESARDTSKEIREKMYSEINDISTDLKDIADILDNIEKKNNLSKQAALKEKIEKLYRECNANMVCTDIAFETLKDLIADYERHGGKNSFVHSLVQPEMYTWKIIDTIPKPDKNK